MDNKPGNDQPLDTEPEETSEQADPSDTTSDQPAPTKQKQSWSKKKKILMIAGISVALVITALCLWWFLLRSDNSQDKASTKQQVGKNGVQQTPITSGAINLLSKPEKLGDLQLFTNLTELFGTYTDGDSPPKPNITADKVAYYQVGSTTDGRKVIVIVISQWDGSQQYTLLEQNGKYQFLALMSFAGSDQERIQDNISWIKPNLADSVSIDSSTTIDDLKFPKTINAGSISGEKDDYTPYGALMPEGTYSLPTSARIDPNTPKVIKKIGESGGKAIYSVVVDSSNANYEKRQLYATIGESYASIYKPVVNGIPLVRSLDDDQKPEITWTQGQTDVKAHFAGGVAGCGVSYGFVVAKNLSDSQLTQVGTSPNGKPLYSIKTSSPLFTEYYNIYKNGSDALSDSAPKDYTKDEYQAAHGLVITKLDSGEYSLLVRGDLFPAGGCGKPVVYLYPEKTTTVHVKVDADVTISDPYYDNKTGWQNVTARPNGQLTYKGKSYDSLFWEGYGHGQYPTITSGLVVAQADAVATIKRQLREQGFNQKETSDFLDFWESRLPNTPYIRLTWFTTGQMNELAPLTISPRPQTVIRTFLDFEGLEKPVNLPPQQFRAPARNGFTVVEWGGLLREGLED